MLSCKSQSVTTRLIHVQNKRRLSFRCHSTCRTRQNMIVIDMDLRGGKRFARNDYVTGNSYILMQNYLTNSTEKFREIERNRT